MSIMLGKSGVPWHVLQSYLVLRIAGAEDEPQRRRFCGVLEELQSLDAVAQAAESHVSAENLVTLSDLARCFRRSTHTIRVHVNKLAKRGKLLPVHEGKRGQPALYNREAATAALVVSLGFVQSAGKSAWAGR